MANRIRVKSEGLNLRYFLASTFDKSSADKSAEKGLRKGAWYGVRGAWYEAE